MLQGLWTAGTELASLEQHCILCSNKGIWGIFLLQDHLRYRQAVSFSVPYTIYKKCEFLQPVSIEQSSTFLALSSNYYSGFNISKKNKERNSVQSRTPPHLRHQQCLFSKRSILFFFSCLTLPKTCCMSWVKKAPLEGVSCMLQSHVKVR